MRGDDGHVMKLSRDSSESEMFDAATLSLGALGIVVSVTLQCERAFNLQQFTHAASLDHARIVAPRLSVVSIKCKRHFILSLLE